MHYHQVSGIRKLMENAASGTIMGTELNYLWHQTGPFTNLTLIGCIV